MPGSGAATSLRAIVICWPAWVSCPERRLQVCKTGSPWIIEVRGVRVGLSREIAESLWVEPIDDSTPGALALAMSVSAPRRSTEDPERAVSPEQRVDAGPLRIALVGAPNTGKTTLFNRLCGLRAKTANFPGTTTDARVGRFALAGDGSVAEIVDLPGTYRLFLDLPESRLCRGVLQGEGLYRQPDAVIVVADATNLSRSLCLVGELLQLGLPTVVALNMVDLAQRRGLSIDPLRLGQLLGCPVVPVVARSGRGVDELRLTLAARLDDTVVRPELEIPSASGRHRAPRLGRSGHGAQRRRRKAAIGAAGDTFTERLDQAFTHPIGGILVFSGIMAGLFWTVFTLATIPMDLIDLTFEAAGGWVRSVIPAGAVRDLLADGVIAGIAGTVVFLPQICLLFFLISLLEDTGYLGAGRFSSPIASSVASACPGTLSFRSSRVTPAPCRGSSRPG